MRSAESNWDYWTLLPESLHQVTIVMSDRGIPRTFRHMHGFGSHTYSFLNDRNMRIWVKFHLRTQQGIENLSDAEAEALVGKDRETHQRDLFESIERHDFPRWTMYVQLMPDAVARVMYFNPFDLIRVRPHREFPLVEVGMFELNRNPESFFAEIEQAAFFPANVVPGIGFSPDRMLQARLFSYGDAQRYRLGVNFNHIPVNAARCPVHAYHRDGSMRTDGNLFGTTSYSPNSRKEWLERPELNEPPTNWIGADGRWDHTIGAYYFEQPGNLFRKMTGALRDGLYGNTARSLSGVCAEIQMCHVDNCTRADPDYGVGVHAALRRLSGQDAL